MRRYDGTVIHEKCWKRLKKYRLGRELRKMRRYNGSVIQEKRRKRPKKYRLKRHLIGSGGAPVKMLCNHQSL